MVLGVGLSSVNLSLCKREFSLFVYFVTTDGENVPQLKSQRRQVLNDGIFILWFQNPSKLKGHDKLLVRKRLAL